MKLKGVSIHNFWKKKIPCCGEVEVESGLGEMSNKSRKGWPPLASIQISCFLPLYSPQLIMIYKFYTKFHIHGDQIDKR